MRRPSWHRHASALLAALLVLTSCRGAGISGGDAAGDLRYGQAVSEHPRIKLQPDVVIIPGAGSAIRSVTADGLVWRIDAHAPRANQLEPGKVMFITERAVGRVLDIAEDSGDLLVTIGPVDITEVIRDGELSGDNVTLGEPIIYPAGEPFWAKDEPPAGTVGRSARLRFRSDQPVQPPPQRGTGANTHSHGYSVFATCCTDGIGAHFSYDDGGVRLVGTVTLTTERPTARFYLSISVGKVQRAELEIGGGFGIKVEFEAGIQDGRNHRKEFPIGVDMSFPIGQVLGIPISFTVSQTLAVATAFGAKLGTIKGSGEFSLAGALGFGYNNGSVGLRVSKNFARKQSLINSLTGVPIGVMGLLIEHGVRFTVGIGALLFKAGIYFELLTKYGMTLGSALGAPLAQCRGVGLGVHAIFGVGYSILEPVVKVINSFLKLLKPIKVISIPEIKASGGLKWTETIQSSEEVIPDVRLCGHVPGQA